MDGTVQAQAESAEALGDETTDPTQTSDRDRHRPMPDQDVGPAQIGKYRVVRSFSQSSGQGAAYLAFDPDVERHVVLKRYRDDPDPFGRPGEVEEGRALARVVSPYVARCLGVERITGDSYLIVEYVPGRNLSEVRGDGPLGEDRIVQIVAQLAEGVAAVHARGLIHRDIKPANVILHDDGTPRLVDFGLAAYLASPSLRELCGTPRYMPPEQARVESDRIDYRADVFGLGAVLYELLTGCAPHGGSTPSDILAHARKGHITPPRQVAPTISDHLETVCLRALAPAPENRYATIQEFREALLRDPDESAPDPSRMPRGTRRAFAVVLGLSVLALVLGLRPQTSSQHAGSGAGGALHAEISVSLYREKGDGRRVELVGQITPGSLERNPPLYRDLVRVHVTLSRPAYFYLIALNPDGKDQLCLRAGPADDEPARTEFAFPENETDFFSLTDGVGLQAFVVVASDRPLPEYAVWKAQAPGALAWTTLDGGGLWRYDGAVLLASHSSSRLRGRIVRRQDAPPLLVALCDRLRQRSGVALVRAFAFAVKADRVVWR
jgi:serine/threonine protein kinase